MIMLPQPDLGDRDLPCSSSRTDGGQVHQVKYNKKLLFFHANFSSPKMHCDFSVSLELTNYTLNPHSLHCFTCESVPNILLKSGFGRLK